ncbi:MAG: hypothetical protein DRG63_04400 [Deltaproteobacteria bacterium]|nr:MAG: hypothetical protein DRG63_04400 [Deltaproteobacteria bacterium]
MGFIEYLYINTEFYEELRGLVENQVRLLEEDRFAEFLALSSSVQKLQDKIAQYQKKLRANSNRSMDDAKMMKAQEVQQHIAAIQTSLQASYEKMERLLLEKQEQLHKELLKIKTGQKALRGYGNKGKNIPRFLETTG